MSGQIGCETHEDRVRDQNARSSAICPVCGASKSVGAVVCWGECWRAPWGLKASLLCAGQWLALYGRR